MDDEIIEEFNEKFDSYRDALDYIADSQAKSEFIRKRDIFELRKTLAKTNKTLDRIAEREDRMDLRAEQTQKHLNHITKVVSFLAEENEFQNEKLDEAGEVLSRKRNK